MELSPVGLIDKFAMAPPGPKYPDPPITLVLYGVVGLKGLKRWTLGEPLTVMAKALLLLSMKRLLWQVKNCVPDTAVSGPVGGVNAPV